jgi:hypothetical protein
MVKGLDSVVTHRALVPVAAAGGPAALTVGHDILHAGRVRTQGLGQADCERQLLRQAADVEPIRDWQALQATQAS